MRRHNKSNGHGTVNQNFAQSAPKWESVGNGILRRKGPETKTAYIGMKGGRVVSLTRKQVDIAKAPKDAPEEKDTMYDMLRIEQMENPISAAAE